MKTSKLQKSKNVVVAPKSKPQVVNRASKGHRTDDPKNRKHSLMSYKMPLSKEMKKGMEEISKTYKARLKGVRPEAKPFKRKPQ